MSESPNYHTYELLKNYLPVTEIPKYYNISEEDVMRLLRDRQVHYAELKHPRTGRRVLQVDMRDVLRALGRRIRLFHLENGGDADAQL